ncbi:MAG: 3-dehydroquinate synthase [Gammaproteobacteria bacterium]
MPITTLNVNLAQHGYPIYIGPDLLHQPEYLQKHIHGKQVMIVSNTQVAPLYLATVQNALTNYQCDSIILPDGESYKTWEQLSTIFTALIEHQHHRSTTLIALGGGVIGDMTGFAAAVYMRGVNFIQIPTSLLAQVDASVGGKTAVNHPLGKNMLGAFYQPQCVIIDPLMLNTLPKRELHAGLAEIIKHAIIADPAFFTWLEQHIEALLALDMTYLQYAIERCCQIKAHIVEQDEREQNIRAWLNFGHTFAHAIETLTEYEWLHGEAVGAGMVLAAQLSQQLGDFSAENVARITQLIQRAQLPTALPAFSAEEYLNVMQRDKKNVMGITFILLHDLGQPFITHQVKNQQIKELIG